MGQTDNKSVARQTIYITTIRLLITVLPLFSKMENATQINVPCSLCSSGNVRVTEIIPLLIPDKDTPDFHTTMDTVLEDKVKPKARGNY